MKHRRKLALFGGPAGASRRLRWAIAVACVTVVGVAVAALVYHRPTGPPGAPAGHDTPAAESPSDDSAGLGRPSPGPSPEPSPTADLSVPVAQATSVHAAAPPDPGDATSELRAGDYDGGAVAYLRFDVPPREPTRDGAAPGATAGSAIAPGPPAGGAGAGEEAITWATVEVTTRGEVPGMVELVEVPAAGPDLAGLTWGSAPPLGPVVGSAYPDGAGTLQFDVSDVVTGPGEYRFAVTVPPDLGYVELAGPQQDGGPVLHARRAGGAADAPAPGGSPTADGSGCAVDELLVPSCGVLWGVAPAGHTGTPRTEALAQFERDTGRRQDIYHAYHRAQALFPTEEEVRIAAEGRILFLNWKPQRWSWAQIAAGHPEVDAYLDRLAHHIRATFTDPFYFTIHHEPENDVRAWEGSGWEATDYAAMFRYVVERLRAAGVDNLVTVMDYLAYLPWNTQPWFPDLYPGDDVVDWIGWNTYAYSEPGYGYGDFAEMVNRRSSQHQWPGFYTWAAREFPDKPLMIAEWGVWHSPDNPGHMAEFFDSAARQVPLFPRLKALVYFDTPGDQRDRDSRPTVTEEGLREFRRLARLPYFAIEVPALTR